MRSERAGGRGRAAGGGGSGSGSVRAAAGCLSVSTRLLRASRMARLLRSSPLVGNFRCCEQPKSEQREAETRAFRLFLLALSTLLAILGLVGDEGFEPPTNSV